MSMGRFSITCQPFRQGRFQLPFGAGGLQGAGPISEHSDFVLQGAGPVNFNFCWYGGLQGVGPISEHSDLFCRTRAR